jgi:heptosyltransferase-2
MKRLVILPPNWLGDAVMALPAIADLRRALPEATLSVATDREAVARLFGLVDDINDVVPISALRDRSFGVALLLPNSFRAALVAFRAGIPERWGYRTDWRSPLLTRAIPPVPAAHQVESYQHLVHALGYATGPSVPRLIIPDGVRAKGSAELVSAGWNTRDPLVALAPGAAYGSAKRWPTASFAELAARLVDDGFRPVLVGGPTEVALGREVLDRSRSRGIINTIGNDIDGLAGVLAHCRGAVSNDSGVMHLAVALSVRVTALFGPTDETKTAPRGNGHAILTFPTWCRPCMLRECPLDHRCLEGISVEEVVGATRRLQSAI